MLFYFFVLTLGNFGGLRFRGPRVFVLEVFVFETPIVFKGFRLLKKIKARVSYIVFYSKKQGGGLSSEDVAATL